MIRIAICDSSKEYTNDLCSQLNMFSEKNGVEISIQTYSSCKNMLMLWSDKNKYADILYLDILMPEMNGMKVAEILRMDGFQNEIIFYSKTDAEAIRGYDVGAFHYIVKDSTSIEKMEMIFREVIYKVQKKTREYLSFSCAGESRCVAVRSIKCFTVNGRVITVHYEKNQTFEFYASMGKLYELLHRKGFVRVSRVMMASIDYIYRHSSSEVVMRDGTRYSIGRNYRSDLKGELENWGCQIEI